MACSICNKPEDATTEWDFGKFVLCQEHWEEYTSETYWESQGGVVSIERDSLERFVAARSESREP